MGKKKFKEQLIQFNHENLKDILNNKVHHIQISHNGEKLYKHLENNKTLKTILFNSYYFDEKYLFYFIGSILKQNVITNLIFSDSFSLNSKDPDDLMFFKELENNTSIKYLELNGIYHSIPRMICLQKFMMENKRLKVVKNYPSYRNLILNRPTSIEKLSFSPLWHHFNEMEFYFHPNLKKLKFSTKLFNLKKFLSIDFDKVLLKLEYMKIQPNLKIDKVIDYNFSKLKVSKIKFWRIKEEQDYKNIVRSLKSLLTIKHLYIEPVSYRLDKCPDLKGVFTNNIIETLNLENSFCSCNMLALLGLNTSLKTLKLPTIFYQSQLDSIAQVIKDKNLKILTLNLNDTISWSAFIRDLPLSLEELRMSFGCIDNETGDLFAKYLSSNTNLTKLILFHVNLNQKPLDLILNSLSHSNLKFLLLYNNYLKLENGLSNLIRNNTNLRELLLNNLEPKEIFPILELLSENESLKNFTLNYDKKLTEKISGYLQNNYSITNFTSYCNPSIQRILLRNQKYPGKHHFKFGIIPHDISFHFHTLND